MEKEPILVDFQPAVGAAPSFQNQRVIARLFQVEAEASAAVGGSQNPGLGRQGGNIEPGGAGRADARQGAGGNDHPVSLGKGRLLTGQMVAQNSGGHNLAAQIKLPLRITPGVFPDSLGGQIHLHDFSHIAGIFRFHRRSPPFADSIYESCTKIKYAQA